MSVNSADILKWLEAAGALLSAGGMLLDDAFTLVDKMAQVRAKGSVDDSDWDALHVYEKKQTDILDAPMEGEASGESS